MGDILALYLPISPMSILSELNHSENIKLIL